MVKNLLASNTSNKQNSKLSEQLRLSSNSIGYFYECVNSEEGHIYSKVDLEKYVKTYGVNPIDNPKVKLNNYVSGFVSQISKYLTRELEIPKETSPIIANNYRLYQIYNKSGIQQ